MALRASPRSGSAVAFFSARLGCRRPKWTGGAARSNVAALTDSQEWRSNLDNRGIGIALILAAVFLLTVTQIVIKSRLSEHGTVPFSLEGGWPYLLGLLADWQVWIGGLGLVICSVLWYAAISRIPLSLAFPFAALSYPLIFAGSVLFLHERFSWQSLAGNCLIVLGVMLAATRLP